MDIPLKSRACSIILKVIVILSAAFGVFLSAYASKDTFMGGSRGVLSRKYFKNMSFNLSFSVKRGFCVRQVNNCGNL